MGGHINFILGGSHGEDTPTSGHKMVAMATPVAGHGPLNLQFILEYFKNENVCNLPNRHIDSTRPPGHVTQFLGKQVKGLGHTGTMAHHTVYS